MMKTEPIGLYVHIPFCEKKCNYCDFCSRAGLTGEERATYLKKLCGEIGNYRREEKIRADSVFFGGGTPSLLSPEEFSAVVRALRGSFDLLPGTEFTVEANPATLTREKLDGFRTCGVNRLSIGLQSIHENELKILGRIHTYTDFLSSFELARACGFDNISVDLMYALPGQTRESFHETLRAVAALSPEHISAYGLILEEGTPFYERRASLRFPGEDAECDMYEDAVRTLSDAGYRHYEISNYAKPGAECRHNLKYWLDREYLGFGVAAYSYFEGLRFGHCRDFAGYLRQNRPDPATVEVIDGAENAYEYAMLRLRLADGISRAAYAEKFGRDFTRGREKKLAAFERQGLLFSDGDRIALTDRGFYVSNAILSEIL